MSKQVDLMTHDVRVEMNSFSQRVRSGSAVVKFHKPHSFHGTLIHDASKETYLVVRKLRVFAVRQGKLT